MQRKTAELDSDRAGEVKVFWEDVVVEFNDYSAEKKSNGVLVATSAYDKKLFRKKMWNPQSRQEIKHGTHHRAIYLPYKRITKK